MRVIILAFLTSLLLAACKDHPVAIASQWSEEVKRKILEDVNVPPDRIVMDSSKEDATFITFYKANVKTKYFQLQKPSGDTVLSIYYSKDQNFELLNRRCPLINPSFEGISYKGRALGLAEFRFCNGKLKAQGYRMDDDVGTWTEWDSKGRKMRETDFGNIEKLRELEKIKYER